MPTDLRTSSSGQAGQAGVPFETGPAPVVPALMMVGEMGEVCIDGVCTVPAQQDTVGEG